MSTLSFIPSATASKPARDFWKTLSSEKNSLETEANNFDQFLKNANENQFETIQSQDKPDTIRPAEIEAKQLEPDRDQSFSESPSRIVESKPKPTQEAVADGEKTDPSQLQAESQENATEAQNKEVLRDETQVVANQEELLAILAQLTEAEAIIRGETQPEAVQMAELTEAMANSELVETLQGVTVTGVQPIEVGPEISIINRVELKEVPTETVLATANLKSNPENFTETVLTATNLKSNPENSTEGKTADLGQLNQTIPLVSEKPLQLGGDSFFNQEQNSGTKGQISESVKITPNTNLVVEGKSQADNKLAIGNNSVTLKANVQTQPEKDQVLVTGQTAAKDGKVDLAVIQTQLAVNDAPKVKTETPVLNIISVQPSINNASQVYTSGSSGANPANREEIFSQIVEHAKVMVNNGGSEMEVNLKPEHLGKLQLKVSIENEVVTAKFVAESQQVKEIIESNLGQLKRNLQENGMQVETIMVSVGDHQGSESFEQAADNQDGFGRFKGPSGFNDQDFDIASEDSGPLAQTESLIDLIA